MKFRTLLRDIYLTNYCIKKLVLYSDEITFSSKSVYTDRQLQIDQLLACDVVIICILCTYLHAYFTQYVRDDINLLITIYF